MKNNILPKKEYLADIKIINGLYATIDPKKIKRNCKQFNINKFKSPTQISKRGSISIATFDCKNNQFIQFQVKWNLKIHELKKIDNDFIDYEIKSMILEAHKLTQINTLKDLFC